MSSASILDWCKKGMKLSSELILFNIGILVDSILTIYYAAHILYRNNILLKS